MAWPLLLLGLGAAVVVKASGIGTVRLGPIPAIIPIPEGWRRGECHPGKKCEVTSDAVKYANERRKNTGAAGTFTVKETATGTFGALTEWHFHEPGGAKKPWGWHHGITILVRK